MRFGVVILPDEPWSVASSSWRRAEEMRFDHAWTYDHLTWRGFRDRTWFGAIPTLTAAATITHRIRLGPLVTSPNFRHPLPLAKELITLDDISAGRITVGIGSGGTGWDAAVLGHEPWSPQERADRFDEFVSLTDRLLREPAVTSDGRYYPVTEARTYPGCVQQPRVPFAIAATGPRGMRLAARYGTAWVTTGARAKDAPISAEEGSRDVADQIAMLEDACADVGRDPSSIDRMVLTGPVLDAGLSSSDAFDDVAGHYAEAGVTDLVVHWPRTTEPYRADPSTFDRIFSR